MNKDTKEWIGGKYEILEQSGKGGAGTVYKVYDRRLDKIWAAKKVKKECPGTEEKLLGKVDGDLFPRIVDMVEENGCRYVVMDWIEGETLQTRLQKAGPFPKKEAVGIALSLCRAFRTLHGMQPPILYLDCKPSNIMIDKSGKLWLIDFGSAVEMGETQAAPISASPGYAAPEQFCREKEKRRADIRSDIFGLGRTLYALLGGLDPAKPPYGACRLSDCNPDVPKELAEIVERCMERRPEKRFQTMDALEHALENLREKEKSTRRQERMRDAVSWFLTGVLIWRSALFFGAAQREPADERKALLQLGFLIAAAMAAVVWQAVREKRERKAQPVYETLQSVVRTEKGPGKWIFLLLAATVLWGIFGKTAAAVEEEHKVQENASPVVLRDCGLRKILVKDGAVLEGKESFYLEICPALFETEEELDFCVIATGAQSGKTYRYCMRYRPVTVKEN
ncbi:MAG: serine/threonine-protein kinase [Eubacteriales bacterium]|nr:serine/threonine-protein kinase [Eubacteriales bacterium]